MNRASARGVEQLVRLGQQLARRRVLALEHVANDVRRGYITRVVARDVYKLATTDSGEVDEAATRALR